MRKIFLIINVVEKAKCFGYTDEEVYLAVKEGIKRFELTKRVGSAILFIVMDRPLDVFVIMFSVLASYIKTPKQIRYLLNLRQIRKYFSI